MPQDELPSQSSLPSDDVKRKTKETKPTPAVLKKAVPAKSPTAESGGTGKSSGAKTTTNEIGVKEKEKKKKGKKKKKSGSPSR
jgi:hypothetical protein